MLITETGKEKKQHTHTHTHTHTDHERKSSEIMEKSWLTKGLSLRVNLKRKDKSSYMSHSQTLWVSIHLYRNYIHTS